MSGKLDGRAGEQDARNGARGVGAVFDHRLVDAGNEVAAAERRFRMGEHQRLAAVQFLHHRLEGGIAQPFVAVAGEQDDAVGLEHVEAIFELAQAAFDVGQRQRREHAEAAGMVGGELRRIVVAVARDAAALRVVADPDAGRGDRGDRGRDAGLVHVGERLLRRPGDRRRLQQRAHLVDVLGRSDVMMHVDAVRPGGAGGRRRRSARLRRGNRRRPPRRKPVHPTTPRWRARAARPAVGVATMRAAACSRRSREMTTVGQMASFVSC